MFIYVYHLLWRLAFLHGTGVYMAALHRMEYLASMDTDADADVASTIFVP